MGYAPHINRALDLYGSIAFWAPPGNGFGFAVDPLFILCQSALETGHFKSDLIKTANNAFGMNYRSDPVSPEIGETSSGFAIYENLDDAVFDYCKRQADFHVYTGTDPLSYAQSTKASGYAEDPDYIAKWMAIWNNVWAYDWAQAVGAEFGTGPGPGPNDQDGTGNGNGQGSGTGNGQGIGNGGTNLVPWLVGAAVVTKALKLW